MGSYIGVVGGRVQAFSTYEEYISSGARQPTTVEMAQYAGQQAAAGAIRCASFNGADLLNPQEVYNRTVAERGGTVVGTVRGYQISSGNAEPGSAAADTNIGNQLAGLGIARKSQVRGPDVSDNTPDPIRKLFSTPFEAAADAARTVVRSRSGIMYETPIGPLQEIGGRQIPYIGEVISAVKNYDPIDAANKTVRNLYVPEGSYQQQQLTNVKLGMSQAGELGWYERLGRNEAGAQRMAVNPDTGKLEPFILIGGAGRAGAQSGMFTLAAASPAVFGRGEVQKGAAGLVTPNVMSQAVAESKLTGFDVFNLVQMGNAGQFDIRDKLSRLGAEGYGGAVQLVDNRILGDITYENASQRPDWSLAKYVNPQAANMGKAELPGARIPWSVGESAPAIFFMDQFTRSGDTAPAIRLTDGFQAFIPENAGSRVSQAGSVFALAPIPTKTLSEISGTNLTAPVVEMARAPDGKMYPVEFMGGQSGWTLGNSTRLKGGKTIAGVPVIKDIDGGAVLQSLFKSGEYEPSGLFGLGGLLPAVSNDKFKAFAVDWSSRMRGDPLGTFLKTQNAMIAPAASSIGGIASRMTFGISEIPFKPTPIQIGDKTYNSEWDRFVEGSGRVSRHVTGLTLEKQSAFFSTIENAPGVFGEAKRGVYFFGTEIVNKPAELAPAAILGAGIGGAVEMAPGALAQIGTGTGATAAAARFMQTPGAVSLAKAGAVGIFGGAYVWGTTEGLTATPQKTKENIYRSLPVITAMYGGGGGFNWLGETSIVKGLSTPNGASFSGARIYDTYFGGGTTPAGGKYIGAFSPTESYVFSGKPSIKTNTELLRLPDLSKSGGGFVDAELGGGWTKPALLPGGREIPLQTSPRYSAGGVSYDINSLLASRLKPEYEFRPEYMPSDVRTPFEHAPSMANEPGFTPMVSPEPKSKSELNPFNPLRKYADAEPVRISQATQNLFRDIHIAGVPDNIVQREIATFNRGFFEGTSKSPLTLIEREPPLTEIERLAFSRRGESDAGLSRSIYVWGGSTGSLPAPFGNIQNTISQKNRRDAIPIPTINPNQRSITGPRANPLKDVLPAPDIFPNPTTIPRPIPRPSPRPSPFSIAEPMPFAPRTTTPTRPVVIIPFLPSVGMGGGGGYSGYRGTSSRIIQNVVGVTRLAEHRSFPKFMKKFKLPRF